MEFDESARTLANLVDDSVSDAIAGEGLVAVAFSGGLDSSIVARCAARKTRVIACTAFVPGSGDSTKAKAAADGLGLELKATELTSSNVGEALARIDLPFEPTLMDRGLWCLYSVVSQSARDSGARVMLLGQLADELFGGYAKYMDALREKGETAAREMMEADTREYALRGRVRDVEACGKAVEPRFPYEAEKILAYAEGIPLSFKLRGEVRKAILRKAAKELGVPEGLAEAQKKAAQYSSGVQKLLVSSRF